MKFAITGATGFLGRHLTEALVQKGHQVITISRRGSKTFSHVHWDPEEGFLDVEKLEGLKALIHLAGENLFHWRWTRAKKEKIWNSRVRSTQFLCEKLATLNSPPEIFISGSAVGYYGNRGNEILTESSTGGKGFLAGLCVAWEEAAAQAEKAGFRVTHLRTGLVLSKSGGVLAKMLPSFRAGLAARFGSGDQMMSWISLRDWVHAVLHIVEQKGEGPFNLTSPGPVSNKEFTKGLAAVLKRPLFLKLPEGVIKLTMGEMGKEMLLYGQNAIPEKLNALRFQFKDKDLPKFLESEL